MANFVEGRLTIYTNEETMTKIREHVRGLDDEGKESLFDFNKVIPMPEDTDDEWEWAEQNWRSCSNCWGVEFIGNAYHFYTLKDPCSPVIKALAKMFPEAEFDYWYEENAYCFGGHEIYRDGALVVDIEVEFTKYDMYFPEDESAYDENHEPIKYTGLQV